MSLIGVFIFILGTVIGSFLNVIGLRHRSGRSLGGRSACPHCGHPLRALDLVPIISFLALRGRCRYCGAKISYQYPIIEIFTGLVFLSIYNLQFTIFQKILLIIIFCLYIAILIYDFWHKIIPNAFVYPAIILSLVYRLLAGGSLLDWLIGPILFTLFTLGWLITRGRALGFADGKLALSIGLLLGVSQGLSAAVTAFWLGTIILVPLMLFGRKNLTMKSEVPFGPFLVLGAWVSLVLNLDLFKLSSFL